MSNFNKKADLVKRVDTKLSTGEKKFKKDEVKELVNVVLDSMKELIVDENHDGLDITGFTKWEVKEVPGRKCRNPQTGEDVFKEAHFAVKAKSSKTLNNLL